MSVWWCVGRRLRSWTMIGSGLALVIVAGATIVPSIGQAAEPSCAVQREQCVAQGRAFVWPSANVCRCEGAAAAGTTAARQSVPAKTTAVAASAPTVAKVAAERCVPRRACTTEGAATKHVEGRGCACIGLLK